MAQKPEHTSGGAAGARAALAAAWLGVVLLFVAVSVQKIWSGDFWGQLRTGQWILENWTLPRVDEYSFTRAGTPVTEVRWLYCVLIALGWSVGAWLLCLAQAVLLGIMWWMLAVRAKAALWTPAGVLVLGLGIAAGAGRWAMRPELVTFFLMAVFLVMLDRAARRGRIGAAWWLVAAQVVWVNTHSLYVFGPILVWTFAGAALVEWGLGRMGLSLRPRMMEESTPRSAARLGVLACAVTAACWVNPYFHEGALYALSMWREADPAGVTGALLGELQSPLIMPLSMWTWDLWATAALAGVVLASFAVNWRRVSVARVLVFAMGVYLATSAQRNAALLAVMGTWAGLLNVAEFVDAQGGIKAVFWQRARPIVYAGLALVSAGFAWYVATDRSAIRIGAPKEFGVGVVEWDTPRAAADFVVGAGAPREVFNMMRDGHFLGWYTDGAIRVFIDGRTDVMGEELLAEVGTISPATWESVTARHGINTAIVPVRNNEDLAQWLVQSDRWALVYLDHRSVVFVRALEAHRELIAMYQIDLAQPWEPRTVEPDDGPEWWKALLGGRGRAWHTQGMANTFIALGALGNAHAYVLRTLEKLPGSQRALAQHAALSRFGGDAELVAAGDAAARRLNRAWAEYSDELLAQWLMESGRLAEAAPVVSRLVNHRPDDAALRVVLADLHFQMREYAAARQQYQAAMARGWNSAAEWAKLGQACDQLGDLRCAADGYRRSLELEPGQGRVHQLLGVALGRMGDLRGAEASLARAVELDPSDELARENLARVRAALSGR